MICKYYSKNQKYETEDIMGPKYLPKQEKTSAKINRLLKIIKISVPLSGTCDVH